MTKLTHTLKETKTVCVNSIAKCLVMFFLLLGVLGVSVGMADGVDEYLVYPWELYQAMSMEEKGAFIENLGGTQAFDEWAYLACSFAESIDEESRALLKYTWIDFESMTAEQQLEFCEALGKPVFEAWMNISQRNPSLMPLYIIDPLRCVWVDFVAMDIPDKEAFSEYFQTVEDFEAWMAEAQKNPQLSIAQIEDYQNCTWVEFSAMPDAQKEAFFELFETSNDFEEWMVAAQRRMKKAKPNTDLTWEELETMSIAEKEAFYESFENAEDFEAWLEHAKSQAE